MSNDRSYLPSDSTTIGTRFIVSLLAKVQLGSCAYYMQPAGCGSEARMEVTREIELPSPPAEVWEALTDPRRLEEWFATEVELLPEPGGRGVFRWADGEERHAVVEEVVPERRFAF